MKAIPVFLFAVLVLSACGNQTNQPAPSPLTGTWKMITATTIKGKDTTVTDYTTGKEFIKIITPSHFSFLSHDLNKGTDSTASFVAGGGRVKLGEGKYTEYLDYCNFREWEGGVFELNYTIQGDTLTTSSVEKIEKLGIDQLNMEKLARIRQKG